MFFEADMHGEAPVLATFCGISLCCGGMKLAHRGYMNGVFGIRPILGDPDILAEHARVAAQSL